MTATKLPKITRPIKLHDGGEPTPELAVKTVSDLRKEIEQKKITLFNLLKGRKEYECELWERNQISSIETQIHNWEVSILNWKQYL